jgi:hypothetical protein
MVTVMSTGSVGQNALRGVMRTLATSARRRAM